MHSTRVIGFQIWNDNLINFKEKLGLPLGKKLEIQIPQRFLDKKPLAIAVLRGIFDTDGGIYIEKKNKKLYPRMYITTISYKLSEQLLELFSKLNLRATRYSQLYNKNFNRQRSYIITIRGVEMFHKFMKTIQPKNPKHQEKYIQFVNSKTFK